MNQELVPWSSIDHLMTVWERGEADVREALRLLKQAKDALNTAFNPNHTAFDAEHASRYHRAVFDKPDSVIAEFSKDAWKALVERLQVKQLCSPKRAEELDKALDGGTLGPLTRDNIKVVLNGFMQNLTTFMDEAVRDLFDELRPRNTWRGLKTNDPERNGYVIGKKVILHHAVGGYGRTWDGTGSYRRVSVLTAMDNVFSLLDGKGPVKSHYGPLIDAINKLPKTETVTETDYFRVKCYHNGNLHVEFKRLDLLAELNRRGGGNNLKPGKETNE